MEEVPINVALSNQTIGSSNLRRNNRNTLTALKYCVSWFGLILGIHGNTLNAQDVADAREIVNTLVTTNEERPRVDSAISLLRLHAKQPEKLKDFEADPSVALNTHCRKSGDLVESIQNSVFSLVESSSCGINYCIQIYRSTGIDKVEQDRFTTIVRRH